VVPHLVSVTLQFGLITAVEPTQRTAGPSANLRIARADHIPKQTSVEVPVWIAELGVAEGGKKLGPSHALECMAESIGPHAVRDEFRPAIP
jgi:hypothetical protein